MSVQRTDGPGNPSRSEQLREAQQQRGQQESGRAAETGRTQGDRLEISSRARQAERLRRLAEEIPEIREDEVARARTSDERVNATLASTCSSSSVMSATFDSAGRSTP